MGRMGFVESLQAPGVKTLAQKPGPTRFPVSGDVAHEIPPFGAFKSCILGLKGRARSFKKPAKVRFLGPHNTIS